MPSEEDTKILKFDQYQESDKSTFVIHGYLECIIEKIDGYKNNLENSSTTKVSKHILSSFSSLQYLHLEAKKISSMYTEIKIVRKSFVNS